MPRPRMSFCNGSVDSRNDVFESSVATIPKQLHRLLELCPVLHVLAFRVDFAVGDQDIEQSVMIEIGGGNGELQHDA